MFSDVPGRLAKTLLSLASRFGKPVEEGLQVPHDLTQEEMAQLVGSSRETVNKALMDFANRGWIARNGRTIIIYSRELSSAVPSGRHAVSGSRYANLSVV